MNRFKFKSFLTSPAMFLIVIVGILIAAMATCTGSKYSCGLGGFVETRCVSGYSYTIDNNGVARQVMDEFGKGVKCH